MAAKKDTTTRIEIQNVNVPGSVTRVDEAKYSAMRIALLKVLPLLPEALFPGGVKSGWWVKTVQLDLEAKRIVTRVNGKPLRWHRT